MVTVSSESHALGYDPLFDNPQEPRNRKLNYPKIWHLLFVLGINQNHTQLMGGIFVILFFIGLGIFLFSRNFDNLSVFIVALIALSPSVMLGIERGNIELIIFLVLSIALIIGYSSSIAALALLLFASILKLYPVFTFIYLLKEHKRKFWTLFLSASGIFFIYVMLTLSDLRQVYLTSPKMAKSSYGLNVFWMGLTHPRLLGLHISDDVIMAVRVLSYILLAIIFMGALRFSLTKTDAYRYKQGQHIDSFRVGAGIYIGCFILGNNFDYRLTFLIFTIPQLVSWLPVKDKKYSLVPLIVLSAILFSCWNYGVTRIIGVKLGFIAEELSNWVLLSGLFYLSFASLPEWFSNYLRRHLFFKKTVLTNNTL